MVATGWINDHCDDGLPIYPPASRGKSLGQTLEENIEGPAAKVSELEDVAQPSGGSSCLIPLVLSMLDLLSSRC